jgi:hypothetical protein
MDRHILISVLSIHRQETGPCGTGVGAFGGPNLSFALSAGLTVLRENNSEALQRGIQVDSGVSVIYDLMSLPLPFSVSLGIDCDGQDHPELCKFIGFYPIIIWDIDEQTAQNPVEEISSYLESAGQPGSGSIVGTILKIPASSQEQTLSFNDGISRLLRIEDNAVMLNDQVITATPASI